MTDQGRGRSALNRPAGRWSRVLAPAAFAVVIVVAGFVWVGRVYTVTTTSMTPMLQPGDRVLAIRVGLDDLRRGDVVVVDVRGVGTDAVQGRVVAVAWPPMRPVERPTG